MQCAFPLLNFNRWQIKENTRKSATAEPAPSYAFTASAITRHRTDENSVITETFSCGFLFSLFQYLCFSYGILNYILVFNIYSLSFISVSPNFFSDMSFTVVSPCCACEMSFHVFPLLLQVLNVVSREMTKDILCNLVITWNVRPFCGAEVNKSLTNRTTWG